MATTLLSASWSAAAVDRVAALVVAALIVLPARPVMAEPTAVNSPGHDGAAARSVQRPEIHEAEALYRGLSAYEVFDYEQAIRLWTDAYHKLRGVEGAEQSRLSLVYNIARARLKAHAIDKDAAQLRQAKLLLEAYLERISAVRGDTGWEIPEESLNKDLLEDTIGVEATLRQIDAALGESAATAPPPETSETTQPDRPRARSSHDPRKGVAWIAAGAATGVVGIGMLRMMAAGLVQGSCRGVRREGGDHPAGGSGRGGCVGARLVRVGRGRVFSHLQDSHARFACHPGFSITSRPLENLRRVVWPSSCLSFAQADA